MRGVCRRQRPEATAQPERRCPTPFVPCVGVSQEPPNPVFRPDRASHRRPLGLVIDCDVCVARATSACHDCVVTYLVRDSEEDAVVIDLAEARALRALGDGGLVPRLRHATMRE